MATRHPPEPRSKRRVWLLVLIGLALGVAWYWREEEPPLAVAQEVEPALPAPPPIAEPDAATAVAEVDASVVVELPSVDAGSRVVVARREPDVEEYMRRWKAALEPLFRATRSPKRAEVLRAALPEPWEADAGSEPCKPKVQRLAFQPRPRSDLVVVIDTSGSMYRTLPRIAQWLADLEVEILKSNADLQLLVVAQQRTLRRPTPRIDAGTFNLVVGSNDALDVLIEGAKLGPNRWVDSLRPSADLHIVVVTDDAAQATGPEYVARLKEVLGELRFTIHLLGGLETPDQGLLAPDQPDAQRTCSGDGAQGLNPGLAYQAAAKLTNGLRAPLCYPASRRALMEALLQLRTPTTVCGWLLESGHRVDRVDAVGPNRPSTSLVVERVLSNCHATRRSYRLAGPLLALCEDTCAALTSEGYDAIEVKLSCGEP